jgi:histone RNA hairpin-binding protein
VRRKKIPWKLQNSDFPFIIHRDVRTRDHPKTPPKHLKYSRRAWEGLIKSWRKKLHAFDQKEEGDGESAEKPADDQE